MLVDPPSPLPRAREAHAAAERALAALAVLPFAGHAWPDNFPWVMQKMQDQYRWLRMEGQPFGDAMLTKWIEDLGVDQEVVEVKRLRDSGVKEGASPIMPMVYDGPNSVSIYGTVRVGDGGEGKLFPAGPPVIDDPEIPDPLNRWVFTSPSIWVGEGVLDVLTAYLGRWKKDLLPQAERLAREPARRKKARYEADQARTV